MENTTTNEDIRYFLAFWVGVRSLILMLVLIGIAASMNSYGVWESGSKHASIISVSIDVISVIYLICSVILFFDYYSWVLHAKHVPMSRIQLLMMGMILVVVVPYVYYWKIVFQAGSGPKRIADIFDINDAPKRSDKR